MSPRQIQQTKNHPQIKKKYRNTNTTWTDYENRTYYNVQVGVFSTLKDAKKVTKKLSKLRYENIKIIHISEEELYKVQIGKYPNQKKAEELQEAIHYLYPKAYIIAPPS